jgi:hypothetical protein
MQNFEHDDANDPTSAEGISESQRHLLCYRLSHCQDGFSRGKSTPDSRQEKHDLARKRKREDDSTVSAPVKFPIDIHRSELATIGSANKKSN